MHILLLSRQALEMFLVQTVLFDLICSFFSCFYT